MLQIGFSDVMKFIDEEMAKLNVKPDSKANIDKLIERNILGSFKMRFWKKFNPGPKANQ